MLLNDRLFYASALDYAIDRYPIVVGPDASLEQVLALMSQVRSSCPLPEKAVPPNGPMLPSIRASCVLVMEAAPTVSEQLAHLHVTGAIATVSTAICPQKLGIFTERDIVRLTAAGVNFKHVKVAEVMSAPAITVQQSETHDMFAVLSLFRQHRIRHLPMLDKNNHLIGIVTPETIRAALQPVNLLTKLRYVKDVMSREVVHAPENACALHLAELMNREQVSCVVITRDRQTPTISMPVGIVTERDIVQFQALELDLKNLRAKEVMSSPLFDLSPEDSLWFAHEQMQTHNVRRLVVSGKRGELLGIVSQTSLLHALRPTEMYGLIEALQQVVEDRTKELTVANEQLQKEVEERSRAEAALQEAHDNLQQLVAERTAELEAANAKLKQDIRERQRVEAALRQSEARLRQQTKELEAALEELQQTQFQLIQAEKMSSLGQLVAGVAHEINNPVSFIYGNLAHATEYIRDLLKLVKLYQREYTNPPAQIERLSEEIDLDFLMGDLPKLVSSMQIGSERIRQIVLSLRNFSRLDEAEMKCVDLHEGLDSTLLILQHRLKAKGNGPEIEIIKEYGDLPLVECYPGPLNQVFMNILSNAIDALELAAAEGNREGGDSPGERLRDRPPSQPAAPGEENTRGETQGNSPCIRICTSFIRESSEPRSPHLRPSSGGGEDKGAIAPYDAQRTIASPVPCVAIRIADNGPGMNETIRKRLFEPFFTTKPVGKGTGLGLSIGYQIVVERHGGRLQCLSTPGQGTEFTIEIPIQQQYGNLPRLQTPTGLGMHHKHS